MKLPKRGFLVDTDGSILWAWEHNDPTTEFNSMPPIIETSDGRVITKSTPGAVCVDCEAEFEQGDIPKLYQRLDSVRVRKQPNGSWKIFERVFAEGPTGGPVIVEIPHHVEAIRAARAAARQR